MIAAVSPHPLSRELRDIGETLPEAKSAELTTIARRVLKLADLALSIEREVGLLRDIEGDRTRRARLAQVIDEEIAAPVDTNVIELGRRK